MHETNRPQMTVEQLMTPDPIVVQAHEPLAHAAHLMDENEVHGMPVVDAAGVLVGVISQTDLVRVRSSQELWEHWRDLAVRQLMVAPVITADRSMSIHDAAALMDSSHVHRLVVVDDEQRRPIGIVSMTDLVRLMSHETADV